MKGNLMRFAKRLLAVILVGIVSIGQPKVADASGIPRDKTMRCPQWVPLFKEYGLPPREFSYIAWRESRCNPRSTSEVRWTKYPDVGLLQIQGSWITVTSTICKVPRDKVQDALRNVHCNLAVARYLYQNGGLGHWSL
jgi:hypothetical protein